MPLVKDITAECRPKALPLLHSDELLAALTSLHPVRFICLLLTQFTLNETMNILISNLGTSVTNDSLRATFATYGEVRSATIMADGSPGAKGLSAIVDMPNELEARAAMARLQDAVLDGSRIVLKEAVQVQPRTFSFLRRALFNKK